MKKAFLLLVLCFLAFSANAKCSILFNTNHKIMATLNAEGFDFKNYDKVCAKLHRGHAKLIIDGMGAVLDGRSIGWVVVRVADVTDSANASDEVAMHTVLSDNASQDVADKLVVVALNKSLDDWPELDKALADLERARAKTRTQSGDTKPIG